MMKTLLVFAVTSLALFQHASSLSPAILSSLYGYDGCIGGVNNFDTEQDYLDDLKRRNCTVVIGPDGNEMTNVVPALNIRVACRSLGLQWLDGMPVVFNMPLKEVPDTGAIAVEFFFSYLFFILFLFMSFSSFLG